MTGACRDLAAANRGSRHVTDSPPGWHRHLLLFREIEMLPKLEAVLRQAGAGRLALDEDYDEFGALSVVSEFTERELRTVLRHYVLNADPAEPDEVAVALADLGEDPRRNDVGGPGAATAAARLFDVPPEPLLAAEAAADQAFDLLGAIGPLPWWDALGPRWPGDAPELAD